MKEQKKAVVFTLGCKVNQYESMSLINKLNEYGFSVTDKLSFADLYIINTCSVTNEADRKSRQAIARALKFNENAKIVVLGCSTQKEIKPFLNKDNVVFLGGASGKIDALNNALRHIEQNKRQENFNLDLPSVYEDDLSPLINKNKAYIKIQDGCNKFCSYCIVPYLRGRSRSRPLDSILKEVDKLKSTVKELVFTGIDISSYGLDINTNLTELIKSLKGKEKKSLGSLDCTVITEDFLSAMRESNFVGSFHLSVQSGSSTVLKRMNRHYTSDDVLDKIDLIRKFYTNAKISADIISCYPLETDAEHSETLQFLKKARFNDIHIFPFSPRIGTKAYSLPQIDSTTRQKRIKELNSLKGDKKMECVFCKIRDGVFKSEKLYEDDKMFIIKDLYPKAKLHYLMIPKKHYKLLSEMDSNDQIDLGNCLKKISELAPSLGLENGYRLVINQGEDAQQTIFHLHIHILGGEKLPI